MHRCHLVLALARGLLYDAAADDAVLQVRHVPPPPPNTNRTQPRDCIALQGLEGGATAAGDHDVAGAADALADRGGHRGCPAAHRRHLPAARGLVRASTRRFRRRASLPVSLSCDESREGRWWWGERRFTGAFAVLPEPAAAAGAPAAPGAPPVQCDGCGACNLILCGYHHSLTLRNYDLCDTCHANQRDLSGRDHLGGFRHVAAQVTHPPPRRGSGVAHSATGRHVKLLLHHYDTTEALSKGVPQVPQAAWTRAAALAELGVSLRGCAGGCVLKDFKPD